MWFFSLFCSIHPILSAQSLDTSADQGHTLSPLERFLPRYIHQDQFFLSHRVLYFSVLREFTISPGLFEIFSLCCFPFTWLCSSGAAFAPLSVWCRDTRHWTVVYTWSRTSLSLWTLHSNTRLRLSDTSIAPLTCAVITVWILSSIKTDSHWKSVIRQTRDRQDSRELPANIFFYKSSWKQAKYKWLVKDSLRRDTENIIMATQIAKIAAVCSEKDECEVHAGGQSSALLPCHAHSTIFSFIHEWLKSFLINILINIYYIYVYIY